MKTLIWLTRLFGQMGDDRKTEEYQQQARAEQPVRPRRHRLLQAPLRRAQGGKEEDQDDAVRATRGKTLQDHHEHGQKEVTHCTSYRAIAKKCSAVLYRSLIWISTSLDILALTIFRAAE